MKRIAVLTSGGDAPGMNAAIRAVVRCGLDRGWEVFGVLRGFSGLIDGAFAPLLSRSVSGVIQDGGTMLGSARCPLFHEDAGRRDALRQLADRGIDGVVVIGGNGSQAEVVVIPEVETSPEEVAETLRAAYAHGKAHAVAVVAEGARFNAEALVAFFKAHGQRIGFDLRTTTLGHVQRGGAPLAFDRQLATRLGAGAIDALADGEPATLVGMVRSDVTRTPLAEVVGRTRAIEPVLFELARALSH